MPYERVVPWFAQRRAFRIIVLLLLLNIVAVTSITWGPITARAFQERMAARKLAEQQAAAAAQQAQAAAAKASAVQATRARVQGLHQTGLKSGMVPGQVVYTEDFVEAARLARDGGVRYSAILQDGEPSAIADAPMPHLPVAWDGAPESRAVVATLPGGSVTFASGYRSGAGHTVFLHERRAAGGPPRLVWVELRAVRRPSKLYDNGDPFVVAPIDRALVTHVFDPATADRDARRLFQHTLQIKQPADRRLKVAADRGPRGRASKERLADGGIAEAGDTLRVMAGQPDPADPSALTIPYQFGGVAGTITVRLGDDDRVRVDPGRGTTSVKEFNASEGEEVWLPHATPATLPARR